MAIRRQLSVTMENIAGTLAKMGAALGDKKVNVLAFASGEREGKSLVRMIVDKLPAAKKALETAGFAWTEEEVLATRLPNRPGQLGTVARKLGNAGINIDYGYSGVEAGSFQQLVVLSVSDLATGKKLIR